MWRKGCKSNEIDSQLHQACYDDTMNSIAVPSWGVLSSAPSELSPPQRHALTVGVVLTHAALAAVIVAFSRDVPSEPEPQPITVSLVSEAPDTVVTPPAPAKVEAPTPPQPRPPTPVARPMQPTPTPPLLTSRQPAVPNDMVAPPVTEVKPQPAPVAAAAAPAPAPVAAPHAPAAEPPRAPAAPKVLPSSAVRYLVEPPLAYPRASRELGEQGVVRLKVLVDETGRPRDIEIAKSSGYPRLDQAAVSAMRAARFQPHLEEGVARTVWVLAPLTFNLED